jgi:hypothetical protein
LTIDPRPASIHPLAALFRHLMAIDPEQIDGFPVDSAVIQRGEGVK